MKKITVMTTLLLGALGAGALTQGCREGAELESTTTPIATEAERIDGFQIDSSQLAKAAAPVGSAARLSPEAFEGAHVRGALLGGAEGFSTTVVRGSRSRLESSDFVLELDPRKGQVLALAKERPVEASRQDEAALEGAALAQLAAFGIPSDEIYQTRTRPLMAQDDGRDGFKGLPRVAAYKTFVFRGLRGIPVSRHRAVVTHDLAGRFQKALIDWPALARAATG